MRTKILFSGLLLSGCSLIVNPADRFSFDDSPEDGGADAGQPVDAESVDAGDIDAGDQDSGAPMAAPTLRYPWNGFRTGSALTGALEPPRNALRPRFMWEPVDGATSY